MAVFRMQKIEVTQDELAEGDGRFNDYMKYVIHRVNAAGVHPSVALFAAADIICKDGHALVIGSYCDDAGTNVMNWVDNYYSHRAHIPYCLPSVAYNINGVPFLFRMPTLRYPSMLLTQVVEDLTDQAAAEISPSKFVLLQNDYNEFYEALYLICRLDAVTVSHLKVAAQYICDGSAHYAMARWESLHFVEKAMKEVLTPLGIKVGNSSGHDVKGALHDAWKKAGKPELPSELLEDVMCTSAMRYQTTAQPYRATIRAHHSSIRLAALIGKELSGLPTMNETLSLEIPTVSRDPLLAVTRAISAIDPSTLAPQFVKLVRSEQELGENLV